MSYKATMMSIRANRYFAKYGGPRDLAQQAWQAFLEHGTHTVFLKPTVQCVVNEHDRVVDVFQGSRHDRIPVTGGWEHA